MWAWLHALVNIVVINYTISPQIALSCMTGPELLTRWDRVGIMPSTTRGCEREEGRGRKGKEGEREIGGSGIVCSPPIICTNLSTRTERVY